MSSHGHAVPTWARFLVLLVLGGQASAAGLWLTGRLSGPARNLLPQALLGGAAVLVVLAGYLLRYRSASFRAAPLRLGLGLLVLLALVLTGFYVVKIWPLLRMPYDIASWSETFFVSDIIKLRTGMPLYLAPDDSDSSTYTPGAPAVTYFLAWLFRRPTSIPFYRLVQQFYLILAAGFAAAASWHLLRLAVPECFPRISRLWLVFFAFASFLFATRAPTSAFNVYLHVDPLALLVSTLAFWLLVKHAATRNPAWLWMMAAMPSVGFLVKQYLAIWAAAYVVYLWLDGSHSSRRIAAFAAGCLGGLGLTVGACLMIWGQSFRYWVFTVVGTHIVSFERLAERLADAAWCVALGLVGGWVLLRGAAYRSFLGIWIGWLVMVLGGIYTQGVTYHPTHLGPATMVGNCFFLAALVKLWPEELDATQPHGQSWFQMSMVLLLVAVVFSGLGYTRAGQWSSSDLSRYAREIEREFDGLPANRVLLDEGDWVYLRGNILMKDRAPIMATHRTPHYGLIGRIQRQEYARILAHEIPQNGYLYDLGGDRGIGKQLLAHYREVRRIPRVRGTEGWPFYLLMMGDVSVLEPIPPSDENPEQLGATPSRGPR